MPIAPLDQPLDARAFLDQLPLERRAGRRLHRGPDGAIHADWFGCTLSTALQPIREAAGGRIVAHEAFLRTQGANDSVLSPWTLFAGAADDARLVALDRLCRTLHLLNWLDAGGDGLLFLNVHGRLLAAVGDDHGHAFRRVVDALGVPASRIVIETPVEASEQIDLLAFVLRNYRANGFQVAANLSSPAQWADIAVHAAPRFVKIAAERLCGPDGRADEKALAELGREAQPVLTRIETLPAEPLPERPWLQGYALGVPESPARAPAEAVSRLP